MVFILSSHLNTLDNPEKENSIFELYQFNEKLEKNIKETLY